MVKDNTRTRRRARRQKEKFFSVFKEKSKDKCFYCERELNDKSDIEPENPWLDLTKDHVIPKSKGGSGDIRNIRICCAQCNKLKADRTPEEFQEFLEDRIANGKYGNGLYRRATFVRILENVKHLIKAIEPHRSKIYREGWDPKALVKEAKEKPKITSHEDEQKWIQDFKNKYPQMYSQIRKYDKDLPKWIYDNLIKKK